MRYTRRIFYERYRQNVIAMKEEVSALTMQEAERWIKDSFEEDIMYCFMYKVVHSKYYEEQAKYYGRLHVTPINQVFLIMVQIWCEVMYEE